MSKCVLNFFLNYDLLIYLAAMGLSCGTQDLYCIMQNLFIAPFWLSSCSCWVGLALGMWDLSSPTKADSLAPWKSHRIS